MSNINATCTAAGYIGIYLDVDEFLIDPEWLTGLIYWQPPWQNIEPPLWLDI